MPATPAWLASLEAALNRSIAQSTAATAAAARLNDTSLKIEVEGVISVRIAVAAVKLALTAGQGSVANAGIAGPPFALLQLLRGGMSVAGAAAGSPSADRAGVRVHGDAEIAARYRELFSLARPDPEEELSRLVGDVPARRVSQLAKATLRWARGAGRSAGENLAEYLQEESRDLVNKPELEEFLLGVDELRESLDRVEARLARLEQRLKGMG